MLKRSLVVATWRLGWVWSRVRRRLGKPRLLRISKRGNGYLRMLLIHGARTALPGLAKKDTPLGRWLKALLARAHRNVVIIALANKLARIAWAVLARNRQYVSVQAAAG